MKGSEMKQYRITYFQRFMGKTLEGSYTKTVTDISEVNEAVRALYDDPHVFDVMFEQLGGGADGYDV